MAAFKPENYGPVGTADDTATLTAMFAAACAAAGPGVIPVVWLSRQHIVSGAASIFTLTAPLQITGIGGFKIKAANGPFDAILDFANHDVTGLHVHGLTFDGSAATNPLTASQITTSVINSGHRKALTFHGGSGITIEGNRFTNFDCTWVIESMSTRAVRIINNQFDTIGSSNPALIHDSSAIYVDAFGLEIAGNFFSAPAPGSPMAVNYGCRTAIEVHGANVTVHDNNVYGFQDGGQLSSSLWLTVSDNLEWHHNNFYGCQIGIALTPYGHMSNISIHDNHIEIDYLTWYNTVAGSYTGAAGLVYAPGPGPLGTDFAFTGLSFKNNQIIFRQATHTGLSQYITSCVSGGFVFSRSDAGALVDRDIEICGNHFTGSVDEGIHLFFDNVDGLRICDNTIRDANTGANGFELPYSNGLYLVSSGYAHNVRIDNNAVIDDQTADYYPYGNTTATAANAFVLSPATSKNCRAHNNQVMFDAGYINFMALGAPFDVSPPLMPAGVFYSPNRATTDVQTYGAGLATSAPVDLGYGYLTQIGCEVTTAAAASSVRLGIYRDNGKGQPGALLLDAGTVDSTTLGWKTITIAQPVTPGKYWLTAVQQGGTPALRILSTGKPEGTPLYTSADVSLAGISGVYRTGVPGALPADFGTPADVVGAYMVFVGT